MKFYALFFAFSLVSLFASAWASFHSTFGFSMLFMFLSLAYSVLGTGCLMKDE